MNPFTSTSHGSEGLLRQSSLKDKDLSQGTPTDVRMFPLTKTVSVPIAIADRFPLLNHRQEEQLAEMREMAMFRRIYQEKNDKSGSSPAQTGPQSAQVNFMNTAQNPVAYIPAGAYPGGAPWMVQDQRAAFHNEQESEEGVFELDL
jgi:hypothetical protein